ncbi:MAG: sigma-70 family RNA polymerase sigma factor [Planctomycetaceae bacterium]|nr:sigma-70 family RNA polymerase sigma factor [Planctomycetaceae bacterium]
MCRSMDDSTSLSLLELACERNESAWGKIVEVYEPLIRLWCQRWGLSEFETDDICQHVFHMAFLKLTEFERRQSGSFRSWIFAISRNKLKDTILEQKKLKPLKNLERFENQPSDTEENELLYRRCISLIESNFSSRDVEIIREYILKDRAARDVAEEFQISENAVYVIKHRVVNKVLEEFRGVLDLKQSLFISAQAER